MQTLIGPFGVTAKFSASMRTKTIVVLLFSFFAAKAADAQFANQSPYSRFGIGDIYQNGNIGSLGLGGVRSTFNDRSLLNSENPATYGYLFNTTLQTSLRFQALRLTEGDNSQELRNGNLDQFSLAMKRAGAPFAVALGVTPFTTTGYAITSATEIDEVGTATYRYEGNGGINKAFLGAGRRFEVTEMRYFNDKNGNAYDSLKVVRHSFGVGANLNYFFGNIEQQRILDFNDVTYLDTRNTRNTRMYDFGGEFGLYYENNLRAKYNSNKRLVSLLRLKAGLIYAPTLNLNTRIEEVYEQTATQTGVNFPVDTAYYVQGEGSTSIPSRLRGGIAIEYTNKEKRSFTFAVDLEQRDWSNYETIIGGENIAEDLVSSSEFSMGIEYQPQPIDEGKSFLSRSQYRFGVRSTETYLSLNGTQLVDEAFTFGLSIPFISSRSASKLHFGMEFGARGVNEPGLVREEYLNILVGVTLSPFYKNLWFIERKYQ